MSEKTPSFESGLEEIPSEEAVWSQFEKILDGREFETIQKIVDEEGLYIWDIKTQDEDGDELDLLYKRAGASETGTVNESTIHDTRYYQGVPCGGGSLYKYKNGFWKVTP